MTSKLAFEEKENHSRFLLFYSLKVEGTNDASDFQEMLEAMDTMKINDNEQAEIFKIVCGILHLGNISFAEGNNDQAFISVLDGTYTT